MTEWVNWFRERRQASENIYRGQTQTVTLAAPSIPIKTLLVRAFVVSLGVCIAVALVLHFTHDYRANHFASAAFSFTFMGVLTWPFLRPLYISLRYRRKPTWANWRQVDRTQQGVACFALAFILAVLVNDYTLPLYQAIVARLKTGHWPAVLVHTSGTPTLLPFMQLFLWVVLPLTVGLYVAMHGLTRPQPNKTKPFKPKKGAPSGSPARFSLWLGESTGWLAERWHTSSLRGGQQVVLGLDEVAQNIVVLGAIGSGKTTRAMHPLLIQLLEQDCGGLIFDIKGDFKKAVHACAAMSRRQVATIGVGAAPFNLLAGLSPEMAASFLKSALLLGGGGKQDSFWLDTAAELCRNALGVLQSTAHYHLSGLYRYLFDQDFQDEINTLQAGLLLNERDARYLAACQQYLTGVFGRFDDKVQAGVLASVAQILSPFQHPDLVDAFCDTATNAYRMEPVLDGVVYLVDVPLAVWGLAGKVVYTLIKLRFFNVMQQRAIHPQWNQRRPVFFMCDEYQEIVSCSKDGLSDLNFWDKSRSSRTIGIISAQSVSSFYAAIGDRDLTHALLQNFRQKLVFRTEDEWTISYCNRLLASVQTRETVQSSSTGSSKTLHHHRSYQQSYGQSITLQQKEVIDGQLFRQLGTSQAVALLSMNQSAGDDVLNMASVFL